MKTNCVFCNIVAGKIPCYKVFENDLFFGFLDIHPRVPGHSLLIPKTHYQWVYDVPEFEKYWGATLMITQALQKVLNPTFVTYVTHGLEVAHAHIHIMPRKHEKEFVPSQIFIDSEKMKAIAQSITRHL